jgi:6-methylsalicylate decarboxylase
VSAVDVHQHLWPEGLIRALEARSEPPRLRDGRLEVEPEGTFDVDLGDHELDRRLALLDRDGVDTAIVSCPPTLCLPADALDAYHEGILDVAGASGGRIVPLATDAVLDGFAGTCVAAGRLLDLDALAPLADELTRRGGFLFVHPAAPADARPAPGWWPWIVDYTAQMQAAYAMWLAAGVERWPELRVVFAILAGGGPFQLERMEARGAGSAVASHRNVFLDTASYGRRALELCVAAIGRDRLVYGSDRPVVEPGATLAAVRGLGPDFERAACVENPERLLA